MRSPSDGRGRWIGMLLVGLAVLAGGCSGTRHRASELAHQGTIGWRPETLEVVVVRHAERQSDEQDSGLSAAGHARALRLARSLEHRDLVGAYASQYRRTAETAAPAAGLHGLQIQRYDAGLAADALRERLLASHRHQGGVVLVVGHSNTVAAIVASLSGHQVPELDESQYGRRFEVTLHADGRRTLVQSSY